MRPAEQHYFHSQLVLYCHPFFWKKNKRHYCSLGEDSLQSLSICQSVCLPPPYNHTVGFDSQFKPSFSIQFDLTLVTQLVTAGLVILALPNVKFVLKFIVLNHQDHACVFCHLPIIPLSPDCVINVGMTIIYKLDESDTLIAIEITSTAWSAALSIWTVQKCCALMDIYWNIVVLLVFPEF